MAIAYWIERTDLYVLNEVISPAPGVGYCLLACAKYSRQTWHQLFLVDQVVRYLEILMAIADPRTSCALVRLWFWFGAELQWLQKVAPGLTIDAFAAIDDEGVLVVRGKIAAGHPRSSMSELIHHERFLRVERLFSEATKMSKYML